MWTGRKPPDTGALPTGWAPALRTGTGLTDWQLKRIQLHTGHMRCPVPRRIVADYTLPDLPYDYGALDPHISGKIMELHHSKHHQNYVNGLNTALEKLDEARSTGAHDTINLLEKNLAFNLGGHINHSIFWKNLSPEGGDRPDGELGAAIADAFGSFDAFQ